MIAQQELDIATLGNTINTLLRQLNNANERANALARAIPKARGSWVKISDLEKFNGIDRERLQAFIAQLRLKLSFLPN